LTTTTRILDPAILSKKYVRLVSEEIARSEVKIKVLGLIASDDKPSLAYAGATKQKFDAIGIEYNLRHVERLELENEIDQANQDTSIHGIFIYFPVFNNQQDDYLRNRVDYRKDIEAGSNYWTGKLYANDRLALSDDQRKKALLPCTPLAILKMLTEIGVYSNDQQRPISGKVVTIFNRSEVIGRPLAVMMSNDGARVYSFDLNGALEFVDASTRETGISRAQALMDSDIVITGVPGGSFEKIRCDEIKPDTVCLNFSSDPNFDDGIERHTNIYIPRVGPMTVAMCMRNTLRLHKNFHQNT
jgi:5,10-methylene-tetrahydrofolate dehydrogenase/methenyl tetrahydrofolate cyclohydrolase